MWERLGWLEALLASKDVWRFVLITSGARCVTMAGVWLMLEWSADSWDSLWQVSCPVYLKCGDQMHTLVIIIGTIATTNAFFGQGTGPIALVNVLCAGTEARLADCSTGSTTFCSHSEDAGVRCHVQTSE